MKCVIYSSIYCENGHEAEFSRTVDLPFPIPVDYKFVDDDESFVGSVEHAVYDMESDCLKIWIEEDHIDGSYDEFSFLEAARAMFLMGFTLDSEQNENSVTLLKYEWSPRFGRSYAESAEIAATVASL